MIFCRLPTFFKINFFQKVNTIRVSNSLDPDQDGHSVGSDFGPNCLQRLSADEWSSLYFYHDLLVMTLDSFNEFTFTVTPQSFLWKYSRQSLPQLCYITLTNNINISQEYDNEL